jgi:hypothetical protein
MTKTLLLRKLKSLNPKVFQISSKMKIIEVGKTKVRKKVPKWN